MPIVSIEIFVKFHYFPYQKKQNEGRSIFTAKDTAECPILIISKAEDVKGEGSGYVVKKDNLFLEEWFSSN